MIKCLYNDEPNFTIVLPVGCNAKCSFCFWKPRKMGADYMDNLKSNIKKLPKHFKQVSISGGEPTMLDKDMFKELLLILNKRFDKVVLNTNGYKLLEFLQDDFIKNNINYINLSRHAINDGANELMFGKDYHINTSVATPSASDIIEINKIFPVRLNCIFDEFKPTYKKWLDFCEYVNAEGVTFRRLAIRGVHGKSMLEKKLDKHLKVETKSKCKVCYGAFYTYKDKYHVTVRHSVDEPMDYMPKDTIFEVVTDGNGDLHSKWDNDRTSYINNLYGVRVRYNWLERILTKLYTFLYKESI